GHYRTHITAIITRNFRVLHIVIAYLNPDMIRPASQTVHTVPAQHYPVETPYTVEIHYKGSLFRRQRGKGVHVGVNECPAFTGICLSARCYVRGIERISASCHCFAAGYVIGSILWHSGVDTYCSPGVFPVDH